MFIRNKNNGETIELQKFVDSLVQKGLLNSYDVTVLTQDGKSKIIDSTKKVYLINKDKYDIYG